MNRESPKNFVEVTHEDYKIVVKGEDLFEVLREGKSVWSSNFFMIYGIAVGKGWVGLWLSPKSSIHDVKRQVWLDSNMLYLFVVGEEECDKRFTPSLAREVYKTRASFVGITSFEDDYGLLHAYVVQEKELLKAIIIRDVDYALDKKQSLKGIVTGMAWKLKTLEPPYILKPNDEGIDIINIRSHPKNVVHLRFRWSPL